MACYKEKFTFTFLLFSMRFQHSELQVTLQFSAAVSAVEGSVHIWYHVHNFGTYCLVIGQVDSPTLNSQTVGPVDAACL
jgi:hypothetical protein